jgi:hypothetical protein
MTTDMVQNLDCYLIIKKLTSYKNMLFNNNVIIKQQKVLNYANKQRPIPRPSQDVAI